jgi:hypothetical protein
MCVEAAFYETIYTDFASFSIEKVRDQEIYSSIYWLTLVIQYPCCSKHFCSFRVNQRQASRSPFVEPLLTEDIHRVSTRCNWSLISLAQCIYPLRAGDKSTLPQIHYQRLNFRKLPQTSMLINGGLELGRFMTTKFMIHCQ